MNENEFRWLRRSQLVEIIYALQQNEKKLQEENAALKKQLDQRKLMIEDAGSLAEACLRLNGVFEAAQAAADEYLWQLKERVDEAESDRTK